jgi:phosphate transport system substrate-binding protein
MHVKSIIRPLAFIIMLLALSSFLEGRAQTPNVIRITGARFTYPLVENWIERYTKVNPNVQIVIESRGLQDPSQYDVLIEALEQPEEIRKNRDYTYVGRYAILPVANSHSEFARTYVVRGLTNSLIKQIFFHDMFADKDAQEKITAPFTTYTRMQKASAPTVFANYFKFEQKDITGKGIAGSDEHLLKAVLRDTTAVSYLPTPMIYAKSNGTPLAGLTPIPVDFNGNDRVSDDEKFVSNKSNLIDKLTNANPKDIHNIPVEHIHLSVDKKTATPEAQAFIQWVLANGLNDLKDFGYLSPEPLLTSKSK